MSTWSDVGRAELGEKEAAHGVDRIGQLAKDAKAYDRSANGSGYTCQVGTQTLTMSDGEQCLSRVNTAYRRREHADSMRMESTSATIGANVG